MTSTPQFISYLPGETEAGDQSSLDAAPAPELARVIEAMRRNSPSTNASWQAQREMLMLANSRFSPPDDMVLLQGSLAGIGAETVGTPEQIKRSRRVMHLHGGGYVIGSPATTRPVASALASATNTAVISIDYRLGPEYAFPAAVHDATAAYLALLNEYSPSSITLSGDSAGGGLALATAIHLRDEGHVLPAAVLGFSPWLDLSLSSGAADSAQLSDPQIGPDLLSRMASAYLQGADPRTPIASPLFASFTDLPPILVQAGTHEYLRNDALRMIAVAREQHADVTVDVFEGMIHVWHALAPRLEAANIALTRAAEWLSASAPAFANNKG